MIKVTGDITKYLLHVINWTCVLEPQCELVYIYYHNFLLAIMPQSGW